MELITVTNGIETMLIHPSTLAAHEAAFWVRVADEPAAEPEAPAASPDALETPEA